MGRQILSRPPIPFGHAIKLRHDPLHDLYVQTGDTAVLLNDVSIFTKLRKRAGLPTVPPLQMQCSCQPAGRAGVLQVNLHLDPQVP
jgi:hypothetical protein